MAVETLQARIRQARQYVERVCELGSIRVHAKPRHVCALAQGEIAADHQCEVVVRVGRRDCLQHLDIPERVEVDGGPGQQRLLEGRAGLVGAIEDDARASDPEPPRKRKLHLRHNFGIATQLVDDAAKERRVVRLVGVADLHIRVVLRERGPEIREVLPKQRLVQQKEGLAMFGGQRVCFTPVEPVPVVGHSARSPPPPSRRVSMVLRAETTTQMVRRMIQRS